MDIFALMTFVALSFGGAQIILHLINQHKNALHRLEEVRVTVANNKTQISTVESKQLEPPKHTPYGWMNEQEEGAGEVSDWNLN